MSQVTEAQLAVRKADKSELHRARITRSMRLRAYDAELAKHSRLSKEQQESHMRDLEDKKAAYEEADQLVDRLLAGNLK